MASRVCERIQALCFCWTEGDGYIRDCDGSRRVPTPVGRGVAPTVGPWSVRYPMVPVSVASVRVLIAGLTTLASDWSR